MKFLVGDYADNGDNTVSFDLDVSGEFRSEESKNWFIDDFVDKYTGDNAKIALGRIKKTDDPQYYSPLALLIPTYDMAVGLDEDGIIKAAVRKERRNDAIVGVAATTIVISTGGAGQIITTIAGKSAVLKGGLAAYTVYAGGKAAYTNTIRASESVKEGDYVTATLEGLNAIYGGKVVYDGGKIIIGGIKGFVNNVAQNKVSSSNTSLIHKDIETVKILNRGNTGRIVPNNIKEQMAMRYVKADPLTEATVLTELKLSDKRWPASEGWTKMQRVFRTTGEKNTVITIHFNYNKLTNEFDDFKFK